MEEKAKALADQREWTSFIDVLALLVFGIVLFPNVDGLVDLVAIDAFLACHHSNESPVIVVLADVYDAFDLRCEKSCARIVWCTPTLFVWLVSHIFRHDSRPICPLQGHRMCAKKGKENWEELLAGMVRVSISWFLLEKDFSRGKVYTTFFIKKKLEDILLIQIYVDDIIFESTNESLCKEFSQDMQSEFEMSMMGELNFFLGL